MIQTHPLSMSSLAPLASCLLRSPVLGLFQKAKSRLLEQPLSDLFMKKEGFRLDRIADLELLDGERLDYIAGTKLKVIQSEHVFSYSIDAILLGRFIRVPIQKGRLLDLCSGNGVIPLILTTRTKGQVVGIEIQEKLIDMANRTIHFNQLQSRIKMIHADLNKIPQEVAKGLFDIVTCNPPYFETASEGEWNENPHFAIARHEIHCSLSDVVKVCSDYVKYKGKVAIVHRPERLTDLITLMRFYRIEPKRIQFIYPKAGKEANMVLIEGIKDGKPGVTCLPPLIIYDEKGQYTQTFRAVYEGEEGEDGGAK